MNPNNPSEEDLDAAIKDAELDMKTPDSKKDERPVAEKLLDIALKNPHAELFHTERQEAFIRFPVGTHSEYALCTSKAVKFWLSNQYWSKYHAVPYSDALAATLNVLQGKAIFEGKEYVLANRVALLDSEIWYDLADEKWSAVRVSASGWTIEAHPPILFRRYAHQRPQIVPLSGGNPFLIFKHINNVKTEDRLLFLTLIITSFIPNIAHPIPYLYGPQGASKSTTSKLYKKIIDPSVIETTDFPKDMREFVQQLDHSWGIMLDNVGYISYEHSDLLCRVVSGSGFVKRELHSDDDDIIRSFKRCICINGINLLALKPDLLERCVLVELERVSPENRLPEDALYEAFNIDLPQIIGGIFDTLSKALAIKATIQVQNLPRMADFAVWGCAIAEALGYKPLDFLDAYRKNITTQQEVVLNENLEATLTVQLMAGRTESEWSGTATQLLEELKFIANEDQRKTLPKDANVFSRKLNALRTSLEDGGFTIERTPGRVRKIIIRKKEENTASTASSLHGAETSDLFEQPNL